MGVWLLIVLLACCTLALGAKVLLLRRDLRVLTTDLHDHLHTDSNTLLTSDSRDPALRAVAATLGDALSELRRQRLRYENGDRELKQAVTNISHDLRTPLTAISPSSSTRTARCTFPTTPLPSTKSPPRSSSTAFSPSKMPVTLPGLAFPSQKA